MKDSYEWKTVKNSVEFMAEAERFGYNIVQKVVKNTGPDVFIIAIGKENCAMDASIQLKLGVFSRGGVQLRQYLLADDPLTFSGQRH